MSSRPCSRGLLRVCPQVLVRGFLLSAFALPLYAQAASYTCRVSGRTVFQETPCGSAAASAATPNATTAAAKPARTEPAAPAPHVLLCAAANGELGFENDSCPRGFKPIDAEVSDAPSTQAPIPRATRPNAERPTTFGEQPDPTEDWTQNSRVPSDVVDVVVRMRSFYGQYDAIAESDIDGRRRVARAATCLRDVRPFDFLDLYKLARPAPHLPPACRLSDFKLAPGRIEYRMTCTQRGRAAVSAGTVLMTKTGVRHEQRMVNNAPSDYLRGNRAFELRRIGDCP